ncbi:hypothetical protein OSCI_4020048 [Kamptonema sp. PCC 6506]|nr:hypothetical protein OSCI_4020048 [Kamptonema sp. PCC 6506]
MRDIGGDRAEEFWLIVGGLILLLILVSNGFFEPRNDNYPADTPIFNENQD